ncbi:MAG TPA: FAD-dependent thymidylate synthase [Candidatus Moranbacteria bacterium]|nr:FAD-dependent thymidylate synthase [Candidatus Moranbacteria bacterium]HRZ33927.1 FAD-dependent thymidylate synthase [Candidatus Moranbacteria bacterium]
MFKIRLNPNARPLVKASHAARKCYQSKPPKWGDMIDVEGRLFGPSHHTTLEHNLYSFDIEGVSIGDITFGMHLANPFYNTDQRSGRYCAKMFLEPNFREIKKYIRTFWPEVNEREIKNVLGYIKKGVMIYHQNIGKATEISTELIKKERPLVSAGNLDANAPKIAQEQMRMFISLIFPTGVDFSVDLVSLFSMYHSAWTPSMRHITDEMVKKILRKFPEVDFMFQRKFPKQWEMKMPSADSIKIKYKPSLKLLNIEGIEDFVLPPSEIMYPIDLLHFLPDTMNNNTGGIRTKIEISAATMGQDQRHRTIGRGEPKFTGNFYLPPILRRMKMEKEALGLMNQWLSVSQNIPNSLAMILAPYGAMVTYKKRGSFNAVAHEQGKRLCFCAQEEIYHLGRMLRLAIQKKGEKYEKLLQIFEPPCYRAGKCIEGLRYCGRDIELRLIGDYFPERNI